ncbi:SMP-30/gluconolactonase/LRE family protein [Shimia abyssi]|uniref:L-arabinonolactonase n=1 Tax=Shimia abyssi TaxID=1662395 RepID=A0A2P8F0X7_9RHOB|nr:SMP-30/gluconolactonase/LRE family protein [Shimia abyssi]PSL15367.1 L-arabinonolactonase [Shimia abyssi]
MHAELVFDCKNQHGEGILWNPEDGCVWWTDIEGKQLFQYNTCTGNHRSFDMPDRVCCFAHCASGGVVVAFPNRVSFIDLNTGREDKICDFEPGTPETRANDGCTDRQGRLIVGGMNEVTGAADSSVICIDTDLSVSTLIEGVSCANSICFSQDGKTMFFADTPDNEILAFDYDTAEGHVSGRRQFMSFRDEPGLPDGSCVDSEGGVWNAEWEGRRVVRMAPDGAIDIVVDVPVWKPTCCAFGGENLDTLFITTSRLMSDENVLAKEPLSGGLFAIKPGFRGVEDAPFRH